MPAFAACRSRRPGLRVWTSSVAVNAGAPQSIGPIELGAADARITVRSVPSGAQVTTGGSFRGVTPRDHRSVARASRMPSAVTRAGYAPWTREVFAEAGEGIARSTRASAALLVEVRIQGEPADAEVFVNGTSRGKAPASLSLPASRHHIEVRKEGFKPFVTDLVLAPGIARTLDFKLVNPKDVVGNSPATITTKSGIKLLIVAGWHVPGGHRPPRAGPAPQRGRRTR